ncbi:hypothetical protein [Paenibacillus sp. FSL R10-2734]|uniref:hypothetical protein n=1 Tax=Paenibacillus sp. FSL R10-2734 TaxID=2954691 RepID=UPI0030D8487F
MRFSVNNRYFIKNTRLTLQYSSGFMVKSEGGFWGEVSHTGLKQPFMYLLTGNTAKSLDPTTIKKEKVFYEEFAPDLDSVMNKPC